MTEPLTPEETKAALAFLGVASGAPDLALLDTLIAAYGRRVPWESASRIAKRARTPEPARAEVAALLGARPDVARPAPSDVVALASRLAVPVSVADAMGSGSSLVERVARAVRRRG
jgi:hypothetical protein